MGEGQSKPIKIKNRRTERGRLEQKEELEEQEKLDLQKRCVPKALQEERRPRNLATMGVPPTTPTAQPLPTWDPQSPAKRGEGNLVRSDSAILRAGGMPRALVRSNSNIVVPVAKAPPQQVLVRSNSSIILSGSAVQAVRAQNLQRSDSSVISATVAAAQAQNMERTNSLTIPKAKAPSTPVGGQAQSNMGRTVSLVVPQPSSPSNIPPVGGYPKSYAMPAKAPPTSTSFVRPAVQAPTGPALTTQTSSQVPGVATMPGVATVPGVATTAPPKWNEVALAPPPSVTVVKSAPTTQKAAMPVLKVRATREERDMISQSAQMTQVSQGPSVAFTSASVPQPQAASSVTLMQTPPTMNFKWTPPPEGAVQNSAPPAQQVRVRPTSPKVGQRELLTGSLQTPLRWGPPQVSPVPAVVKRSASSQRRSAPKMSVISTGETIATQPVISPRPNPSPDAKAAEPVGGPSLVRAMAAKYQDIGSTPAPQPAFDPTVTPVNRDMDTHYQGSSQIKNAMQDKPEGQLWV